uniref:Glycosyltransferase 1 domain containing 1 n=1 Tax=Varanus komodoensis TaxID=61221 RepID=A0A8D2Q4M6_VARKO
LFINAAGHRCTLKDTFDCKSPLMVSELISSENFEAALGIHLYKAGRLLQGSRIPFGIIFGGTDINEDAKSDEKLQVMGLVLDEARFAVSFTEAMKETAVAYWVRNALLSSNLIRTGLFGDACFKTGISQDSDSLCVFLLICGLRRVKDPLYVVDAFAGHHRVGPSVHLCLLARADGVHLLREIPQKDLHAVVKKSFAVVNSSISEGMSAAILEAMDLSIPVLARNIPGNAAIIAHQETGLLYSTPQEFVRLSRTLTEDPFLHRRLVMRAKEYVTKHHLWDHERTTYQNLMLKLH